MRPRDQGTGSRRGACKGVNLGRYCASPDLVAGLAVVDAGSVCLNPDIEAVFVVERNQQGFVTDLEACGAYYGYYPPNYSVPSAPTSAEKSVRKVAAAGSATSVHSGRVAYADLVGHSLCSDARCVQETHEASPAMESTVGRLVNPLDGALNPLAAHVLSLPPLPAHAWHSF